MRVRVSPFAPLPLRHDDESPGPRLLPDETTTLVFADGAGIPRAVIGLLRGEAANLLLADAEGVSRIGFGLDSEGFGSVLLPENTPPIRTRDR